MYDSTRSEDQLVREFAPLVRTTALRLHCRLSANVELDDLIGAGTIGLLDALRKFEPQEASAGFEAYASQRIKGAMLDELREQDWLPRSVRSKSKEIESAVKALEAELLRAPSASEIALRMGLSDQAYAELLDDARGVQVIMSEDIDSDLVLGVVDDDQMSPEAQCARRSATRAIARAIASLPEREAQVLSLQFEQGLNQKEIAQTLDLTAGRVSQLRTQAIVRMRASLDELSNTLAA